MSAQPAPSTDFRDPRELRPHPDNPRGEIDPNSEEILSLAADIAEHNILQPLVITSTGLVHIGHRRRVAAIAAGLDLVPVIVRDLKSDEFVEEIFLSENMQRQDLSPLEEARAIAAIKAKLQKRTKKPVLRTDLVRRLKMTAATIGSRLAILELPARVQQLFHIGEIPINSSTQLARLKEWPEEVEKFADRLTTRQLTARSLETVITRRLQDLHKLRDNEAQLARSPKIERILRHHDQGVFTPPLTREIAVENLDKKGQGSVSLFNLKLVLEQTCCSCGMVGNNAVCLSCPLPKFVNGLVGRADTGRDADTFDNDED